MMRCANFVFAHTFKLKVHKDQLKDKFLAKYIDIKQQPPAKYQVVRGFVVYKKNAEFT